MSCTTAAALRYSRTTLLCTALVRYEYESSCCTRALQLICTRESGSTAQQYSTAVLGPTRAPAAELYESCSTAALVLVLRIPTAVGELIFSHSYNFYFGREYTLGATIGAMAKFAHVTNRHKFS